MQETKAESRSLQEEYMVVALGTDNHASSTVLQASFNRHSSLELF